MLRVFRISFCLLIALWSLSACKQQKSPAELQAQASSPTFLHSSSEQLTDVIVFDIFKPPVASRIYAYTYLGAYEVLRYQYPGYASLAGKLNAFSDVPAPDTTKQYCFPLASMHAFHYIGKALTFSTDRWDSFAKSLYTPYQQMGISEDVYANSLEYGESVAKHVLSYAQKDNYKQNRGFRHTLSYKSGSWEPTPPTYGEACEPSWNTIRPFILDSINQFTAPAPAAFDLDKNSPFYKLTSEVYELSRNLTEEQKSIAYFWDDNAFVTNIIGHATIAEKKMTPPGHWMAITRTLAKDKKLDMMQSLEAYTLAAIALNEAFIVCWEEKYKTDRIRPITVINKHIDDNWEPFLETPSFPEYVSGHSAISASAGRILINFFGNNVAFTDSTEYKYGHGVRSFKSIEEAYWETSMSRVYGGIHFRDGAEEGTSLGEKIGDYVWSTLKQPLLKSENEVVAEGL